MPAARFERADIRELSFEDATWDAFSMLQPPRAEPPGPGVQLRRRSARGAAAGGLEPAREEEAEFVPDHDDAGPEPHVHLTARTPA
ncbi:hypothetical protein [Amycolatopsis sp. cmx-4-61]|uniref:hypothetical protein n=1 Tax=Amycolatopsis sp. cmx-4-61 TaxID=2790937 RepID=UPI00397BC516